MVQSRQTAYKVWVSDILRSEFKKTEGEWEPNYFLFKDKKISRVNLMGVIISKYLSEDESYCVLELDDSSGVIKLKSWREDVVMIKDFKVGDFVLVIGRPRGFGGEIYLSSEIVRKLDDIKWVQLRNIELEKEYGKPLRIGNRLTNENEELKLNNEEMMDNIRQRILKLIDNEEEVSYDKITTSFDFNKQEVDEVISVLIKEGEIYQPRPGFLRII
mgnify:CR=1 FL=1